MNQQDIIQSLETAYTDGFESLVSAIPTDRGVQGQFFDRGIVYNYTIDDQGVEYQESRSDSAYIADYFRAYMAERGVRCDSDNPYEYYKGRFQVHLDAGKKPMCKSGNPCGNRCLPRGQKCRVNGAGLKNPGSPGSAQNRKPNAIEETGDVLFGNLYTDLRQRQQTGKVSGRRILARNLLRAGLYGAATLGASALAASQANKT